MKKMKLEESPLEGREVQRLDGGGVIGIEDGDEGF